MKLSVYFFLTVFLSLFALSGYAQNKKDSARIDVGGEWRTFYMHTWNEGSLKDYAALATGGKFDFRLALSQHWQVGVTPYLSINTGVTDISERDVLTNSTSRYEKGMFNSQDLDQDVIALIGELYLRYTKAGNELTAGRMKLNTPFLNPQDGWMIPTLFQGIWYKKAFSKKTNVQIGIIDRVSPRGTDKFYKVGDSFGRFGLGRNVDGSPSGYKNRTSSDFLAVLGGGWSFKNWRLQLWDYWTDNVSNTFQMELKKQYQWDEEKLDLSFQYIHQDRLNNGGNADVTATYFSDASSNVYGFKAALFRSNSQWSIAYNRVTNTGRFLFPREWGIEGLYTFITRERTDGYGGADNLMFKYGTAYQVNQHKLNGFLTVGHYWRTSPLEPALNKYALADYMHAAFILNYENPNFLKGLKPHLRLVYRAATGDTFDNPAFIINRVNLFHLSFRLSYHF